MEEFIEEDVLLEELGDFDFYSLLLEIREELFGDEILKMDLEYFTDKGNIRFDLESYATALGLDSVFELRTHGRHNPEVVRCANGEMVQFNSYLAQGGMSLGLAKDWKEAFSLKREILDHLLRKAGYELRDLEYYSNAENVRKDLLQYCKAGGFDSAAKISTVFSGKIRCSNGELVSFGRYLAKAGVSLGLSTNSTDAMGVRAAIRDRLVEIAGL